MKFNNLITYINLILVLAVIGYLYSSHNIKFYANENNSPYGLSTEELNDTVKDIIRNNPESIIQSLEKYRLDKHKEDMQNASAKVKLNVNALYDDSSSPSVGRPDSKMKLVEFFDYNCGYCRKMLPVKLQLLEHDKEIKIIFKELPVLGENSIDLAKASLAINSLAPDKYFKFHSSLLAHKGPKTKEFIESKVKELGINVVEFNKAKDSEAVNKMLEANFKLAKDIGLSGSPAYIIGDEVVLGSITYTELEAKINEQRKATN